MGSLVLSPTVILRAEGDTLAVTTTNEGEREALLVFRGPEEAGKYQEHTGKSLPSDGFLRVQMGEEGIVAVLKMYGIGYVAMPEPWTGGDGVDLFTAENFLRLLKESEV